MKGNAPKLRRVVGKILGICRASRVQDLRFRSLGIDVAELADRMPADSERIS